MTNNYFFVLSLYIQLSHPLCHQLEMLKPLVIHVVIKLYTLIDTFK